MEKRPTDEQLAKYRKNAQDQSLSAEVRAKFQAVVDKFSTEPKERVITIGTRVNKKGKVEPFRQENGKDVKRITTRGRKPASAKTKKTATDIEKAKAEIKAKTGKTEAECESIIEQYRSLRSKAQEGKRKAEKANTDNKERVSKLERKGDIIEGTNEKTADAVIESTAKDVAEKIEKQVEAVEAKAETEAKAEVAKDKTITTPKAKKEAIQAKVEKKVAEKTKTIVKRVVIDTSALLTSIATSLGKFDKDSQKEFLIKLRSDIDKLLAKYAFGGMTDGATQVMNVQQSNMSSSSVNPSHFGNGGGVGSESSKIYKLRAEGLNDFLSFLQKDMYFRIKSFTIQPTGFPDVVVTFETDASLSEIKSKIKEVPDSHVMLQTIKPINEYSGERNDEFANGGGVGSMNRYDAVVYFVTNDGEDMEREYLGINASSKDGAESIARIMFFRQDADRYDASDIEYVSVWDRGTAFARGGGVISVYELRKGDKIKTRKGDIETIERKIESGYFTYESKYSHPFESIEFVERPKRKMAEGGGVDKLPANLKKRLDTANKIIVKYNGKPLSEAEAIRFNSTDPIPQSGYNGGLKAFKLSNSKGFENATKRDYQTIGDTLIDISRKMSGKDIYANGGGVDGYNNPKNDTHVLIIDSQNWYLEKIDSTHFYMSNSPNFRGMANHVGQHKGEPYYEEIRQWLHDTKFAEGGGVGSYGKGGGIFGESARLEYVDDAFASSELKDELREKLGIEGNSLGDNVVISFAYTDYGGDFLDKVAIKYFIENYPDNIVSENAGYNGENAYVFGEPAQEWIDTTDDYPLGFEDIEEVYNEMTNEAEYESYEYFLDDLERDDYVFDREEVLQWLMENKGGYYSMTTTGLDFSYSDLTDELLEEGLISKEDEDEDEDEYARGGGIKDVIVYDNNRETFDRYTIFTPDGSVYGMSDNALMPNGFNMYIGDNTEIQKGSHLGKKLKSVPESIKIAVERRMSEEYARGGKLWIDTKTKGGLKGVKPSRKNSFARQAQKRGITSGQLASKVIANPSRYQGINPKSAQLVKNMGVRKRGGSIGDIIRNRRGQ